LRHRNNRRWKPSITDFRDGFEIGAAPRLPRWNPTLWGRWFIDLFDARTKPAIFRGAGSDTIPDKPEKNEEQLKKSMEKIFKKFAPEAKG